jgi:hypothetical protein
MRRVLEANLGLVACGLVTEVPCTRPLTDEESPARTSAPRAALSPEQGSLGQTLLDKHYRRKHGTDAYYAQR